MEPDDGPGTSRDCPIPQKAVKRRKDSLTVKAAKKIRHLLSPQKRKLVKEQRQMRTKQSGQCPICLKTLKHVSKHIREFHRIENPRERTIINAISTGRVHIGKGPCPVPGCGLFRRRLSNHIEGHIDLLPGRREAYQQVARRDAALKRLSELWATDPQPPMASVLDLEDSLASECRNPSCIQREFRIRELESTDKEPAQDEDVQESEQSGVYEPNPLDPEEQAVALDPEEQAVPLDPEEPAVALDPAVINDHTAECDCFLCFLFTVM
uniref:C2H2-type domain-containing protein n=1 Tax=Knipowitschia caucasica TaxID=637954 RepID=A0AAV2LVI2_KNICA